MFFLFDFLLTFSTPCSFHIGLMGPRQSQQLEEEEEALFKAQGAECDGKGEG